MLHLLSCPIRPNTCSQGPLCCYGRHRGGNDVLGQLNIIYVAPTTQSRRRAPFLLLQDSLFLQVSRQLSGRLRQPPRGHQPGDGEDWGRHDQQAAGHEGCPHRLRELHMCAQQCSSCVCVCSCAQWWVTALQKLKDLYFNCVEFGCC